MLVKKKSFTLVEVAVSIAVLSFVAAMFSSIFWVIQNYWVTQRDRAEVVQNARWAMEFMSNEIRYASRNGAQNVQLVSGVEAGIDGIHFHRDNDNDGATNLSIWYWRGNSAPANEFDAGADTTGRGDQRYIYRGAGNNLNNAYAARRIMARYVIDNTGGAQIFGLGGNNMVTMLLTVRPKPLTNGGPNNASYTLRTQARPRNY